MMICFTSPTPSKTNQHQWNVETIATNPIKKSSQYRQTNQHQRNIVMLLRAQETQFILVSAIKYCLALIKFNIFFQKKKKNLWTKLLVLNTFVQGTVKETSHNVIFLRLML